MKKVTIVNDQVDEIVDTLIVRKYQNTKEGSQNHGKSYKIFSYDGNAFAVHQDHDFIKQLKAENVYSVSVGADEEGQLSLLSFQTITKKMKRAQLEGTLKYYSSDNYKPEAITNPEEAIA